MFAGKRELTHDEKLRAAYACLINGVHQHHIAALYGVNQGRISEAVMAVEKVCGFPSKKEAPASKDVVDECAVPYISFLEKTGRRLPPK